MPGDAFAAIPGTKVPPGLATDAALAAQPGEDEVLLVFDYYHLIDAQPVHASLEFLLEHLPQCSTWSWPDAQTRRCRWRGCGPAVSSPSCGPTTCGR